MTCSGHYPPGLFDAAEDAIVGALLAGDLDTVIRWIETILAFCA